MEKKETKKAAKARQITEKIAAKEKAKEDRRQAVFSTPVAIAVEPLRVDAMKEAKTEALAEIKAIMDKIETIGGKFKETFDINAIAKRPDWFKAKTHDEKKAYEAACNWRGEVHKVSSDIDTQKYYRDDSEKRMVKIDADKIAQYVVRAQEEAALDFESFVYKLVDKVGPHKGADLSPMQGVWTHSLLSVTKKDGTVQKWETKRIINRSCLGKLFFQWPTRLMKGEK